MNQRVTENDAYVNSCVTEILCRALSDDEWTLADFGIASLVGD